jgi:RNA polymerase sigma-70 factor (ECF subfamily)
MARDDDLLAELVRRRRSALVGYAYVLTGDVAAAEDVVHEALYKTFVRQRGLADVEHAEAYVRRAIVTTFLNMRRSRRRFVDRMHLFTDDDTAPDHAARIGEADAVRAALDSLSPRERACVVLHHMEHMRVREVAATLGLAEGTVKRYLSDGKARLQHHLGPLAAADDDFAAVTPTRPGGSTAVRHERGGKVDE